MDAAATEFLDELLRIAPFKPKLVTEPWEHMADECVVIPVALVREISQPNRLVRIANDDLTDLVQSLRDEGLRDPLQLLVDDRGRLCLQNGHHRLLAAEFLGRDSLPVRIESATSLRVDSYPAKDVLFKLLKSVSNFATDSGIQH